jgi:hypothetical protein
MSIDLPAAEHPDGNPESFACCPQTAASRTSGRIRQNHVPASPPDHSSEFERSIADGFHEIAK